MIDKPQLAREIRSRHFTAFQVAQELTYHELHRAVDSLLRGRRALAKMLPFEHYRRAAEQLAMDAETPDDVLLAEEGYR